MRDLINEKLDRVIETVDNINSTLNDGQTGLKTRMALIEQSEKGRVWAFRALVVTVMGLVGKLIVGFI